MIAEIVGVGPSNKGAELMLQAILEHFEGWEDPVRFVVNPACGDYKWRASYGLYQRFDPRAAGRLGGLIARLMHRGYRSRYGLVAPDEIDVILCAEGYAYGDPWKPEWVEGAAKKYERAKQSGQKIVLLPQAFGPFENSRVRSATGRILASADLVFARDQESFDHLRGIAPAASHLNTASDFTNVLKGQLPENWKSRTNLVALVPNRQMIGYDGADPAAYARQIGEAAQQLVEAGFEPLLVVHERNSDLDLAKQIQQSAACQLEIFAHENPIVIKGVLGECVFAISSRFHALSSALSQGIPCIATGWSHSYRHLMDDYGVADCLVNPDQLAGAVADFADPSRRNAIKRRIEAARTKLDQQTADMWRMVGTALCER